MFLPFLFIFSFLFFYILPNSLACIFLSIHLHFSCFSLFFELIVIYFFFSFVNANANFHSHLLTTSDAHINVFPLHSTWNTCHMTLVFISFFITSFWLHGKSTQSYYKSPHPLVGTLSLMFSDTYDQQNAKIKHYAYWSFITQLNGVFKITNYGWHDKRIAYWSFITQLDVHIHTYIHTYIYQKLICFNRPIKKDIIPTSDQPSPM